MHCLRRFLLICVVVLAGCADQPPLTGQAQADAETQAACRQRAEAVYNQQNRAADLQSLAVGQHAVFGELPAQPD